MEEPKTKDFLEVKPKFGGNSSKGVKLAKIEIKKFAGDPLAWQEFKEIFEATVDGKTDLSDIEKFSYLRCHPTGDAEKCIENFPLTNKNYQEAFGDIDGALWKSSVNFLHTHDEVTEDRKGNVWK